MPNVGLRQFGILGFFLSILFIGSVEARPCTGIIRKLSPLAKVALAQHGNTVETLYYLVKDSQSDRNDFLGRALEASKRASKLGLEAELYLIEDRIYLGIRGRISQLSRFAADPDIRRVRYTNPLGRNYDPTVDAEISAALSSGFEGGGAPAPKDIGFGAMSSAQILPPSFGGSFGARDSGNIDSINPDLH